MKSYNEYKDSGVEWIGEIPKYWRESKLKFIGSLYSGLTGKKGDDFTKEKNSLTKSFIPFTNVANNEKIDISAFQYVNIEENEEQNLVKKGDLFFMMSSENFDDVGKTTVLLEEVDEVYLNSFCRGFRITDDAINPLFLNYLLLSTPNRKRLLIEANGFTRINLKVGKVNDLKVFFPPSIEEQTQIALYLDHKTSQIDKLITDKEKLIELLNEERTAIINQAVTRGLNPDVPMKDSGIEWLGKVPEHWEVKKISHVALITKLTGFEYTTKWRPEDDGEIIALRGYNVKNGFLDLEKTERISTELSNELFRSKLFKNDIVYPCTGTIGNACLIEEDNKYHINQNIAKITPKDSIYPKYLLDSLLSSSVKSQIHFNNSSDMQPVILIGELRQIRIAYPPLLEQLEIAEFIAERNSNFDKLLDLAKKEIQLLKEYKTALISEVVTGKVDVRNEVIAESTELVS